MDRYSIAIGKRPLAKRPALPFEKDVEYWKACFEEGHVLKKDEYNAKVKRVEYDVKDITVFINGQQIGRIKAWEPSTHE